MELPYGLCDVSLRLGRHTGPRRLSIRAELDPKRVVPAMASSVWGRHAVDTLATQYVEAVRDGMPKLQFAADGAGARVVSATQVSRALPRETVLDIALPPTTRAELQPLVTMLRTGSMANGTARVEITEVGTTDCDSSDAGWSAPPTSIVPPFSFEDRASGVFTKDATLHLVFQEELEGATADQLERWVRAWTRLVSAGGFFVPSEQTPSFAALAQIVDPYPNEWMARFDLLVIDRDATALLLERLVDIHSQRPIARAELG